MFYSSVEPWLMMRVGPNMRSRSSKSWLIRSGKPMSRLPSIRTSHFVLIELPSDLVVHRALHQLSIYDSKAEPDLGPIAIIRLADMIMHLWQRYTSTALLPLAGTSVTVRREMGIFNNQVVVRIEGKVNSIVQRTTDGLSLPSILLECH